MTKPRLTATDRTVLKARAAAKDLAMVVGWVVVLWAAGAMLGVVWVGFCMVAGC